MNSTNYYPELKSGFVSDIFFLKFSAISKFLRFFLSFFFFFRSGNYDSDVPFFAFVKSRYLLFQVNFQKTQCCVTVSISYSRVG